MIDIPLRDMQINRVLGFLDEQLGDNDVTIVLGDAADGRVYFVSNRSLNGYQKQGGIYIRGAGIAKNRTPPLNYIKEKTASFRRKRNFDLTDEAIGAQDSYAWVDSPEYGETMWHSRARYHVFPSDRLMVHECIHAINDKHPEIVGEYSFVEDEALAIIGTMDYTRIFLPDFSEVYHSYLSAHPFRSLHRQSTEIAFNRQEYLRQLQAQIREKNLTARAA